MVAWVFAGGGESEIRGLIPFLRKHFNGCSFERKTPVNKKIGPRPEAKMKSDGLGKTGKDLSRQIIDQLKISLYHGKCDLILIVDDLDCCHSSDRSQLFIEAISKVSETHSIPQVFAFAAPEIESWIIADWDNTVAKDIDFRGSANAMKHWLSHVKKVPFTKPESFGEYDAEKKACKEKLSALIIEASLQHEDNTRYSKGIHTPRLLQEINPITVSKKCPLFKKFYLETGMICVKK